jgi:hypothetical protein
MTGERIDDHTDRRMAGGTSLTDDELVDLLLDQQAALAIADGIRDRAMGVGPDGPWPSMCS